MKISNNKKKGDIFYLDSLVLCLVYLLFVMLSEVFINILPFSLNLLNKKHFLEKNKNMKKMKIFGNIFIGFIAGMISGFFGAGGGLILVPYMTLLLKEDEVKSRATTIMCIFFMVLTSSFFYFKESFVDWNLALKCAIGGIIGGIIGSKLLINLSKNILQIFFIVFLLYAGIKMII